MITIGLILCDSDYQFYDRILFQIKERVKVDYELIIIDNTTGNKLGNKATFAFGYNALQFAARYKIIKMAKGEYLWFIDGDDEVLGLEEIRFNDDILSYNVRSETIDDYYEDELVTKDYFRWYFIHSVVHASLWNKLIRRSLFDNLDEYVDNPLLKVVSLEDTFYLALALKNAKSVHICHESIYKHYRGTSSALYVTPEQFNMLITGFSDILKLLVKLGLNKQEILSTHLHYFSFFVMRCDNPSIAMCSLIKAWPDKDYWISNYQKIINAAFSKEDYYAVRQTFIDAFGKDSIPLSWYETVDEKGNTKKVFFEPDAPEYSTWNHDVSIICLVYDGNVHYLNNFTKMIKSKIHVKHEVVIVDNRDDKTEPLEYYGDAVIVKTEKNLGILDGRRAGCMAANSEYIWFVDIDDMLLPVFNRDYGNSDILSFPFYDPCENRWGRECALIEKDKFYTDETLYRIGIALWNKWYKKDVLIKAYKNIPSFFCVYNEDNLVYLNTLKYAEQIECILTTNPIYAHIKTNESITTSYIKTNKTIDTMFLGFDEVQEYLKTHFPEFPELTYNNPYQIIFYLKIFEHTAKEIRQYFMKKLKDLYGEKMVQKAFDIFVKEDIKTDYNCIKIIKEYI